MVLPCLIGRLPPWPHEVYIISLVAEYILGIDVLSQLRLQTTTGEFQLRIPTVKGALRGHARHPLPPQPPRPLTQSHRGPPSAMLSGKCEAVPTVRKAQGIGAAIQELEEVKIIYLAHSPFNAHRVAGA